MKRNNRETTSWLSMAIWSFGRTARGTFRRKRDIMYAMANVPTTSVSLLKDIASGSANARWAEFYRAYESAMRGFLRERFPSVEADDAIQETLIALMKALPDYRYVPDEKGHFRNYLTGILAHKATDLLRSRARESRNRERFAGEPREVGGSATRGADELLEADERSAFEEAALNAALEQLLHDQTLSATHREIFRHVALLHEPPADVAAAFGVTRNNVDQIRSRMTGRLEALVRAMLRE